jgi:hypothetical protein
MAPKQRDSSVDEEEKREEFLKELAVYHEKRGYVSEQMEALRIPLTDEPQDNS